jgi:phosphate transport system permease protein
VTASTATATAVERSLGARRRDWVGIVFQGLLLLALLFSLAVLATLLTDVVSKAIPVFADRGTDFLTSNLSTRPNVAGVWQGLTGSLVIAILVALFAFPVGIMTAIYLEEYAPDNRLTRLISVNIRNLAGVPSVVYGLLGLSVFVAFFSAIGMGNGRTVIAGALTLAVLVLPIVINTSAEALRSVPQTLREAGYGVGASRWEVTRKLTVPAAAPGILTGTILALSRALGETAPLLLAGAVLGSLSSGVTLTGPYTVLPMTVYDWSRKPQADFRLELAPAAIVVLLAVTLLANAIAIVLRNRFERAW